MVKKLLIRDVTLRDSQEILFAAKMTQADIDYLLPYYKKAGFYALDVWGDTVPGNIMRYWAENPWTRIEKIKAAIGNESKLAALARGRNLLGHAPFPDKIIKDFYEVLEKEGIDLVRIYDPLNDIDNLKPSINYIKEFGAKADVAICFSLDPHYSVEQKLDADLHGSPLSRPVYTNDYFLKKALEAESAGADTITLYDVNGLIAPERTAEIMTLWKKHLNIPVDFHTRCSAGYGLASTLSAIVNGADIVDTSIWYFSQGDSTPAIELIYVFCKKLGIELDLNMDELNNINTELARIRVELSSYEVEKQMPNNFYPLAEKLPEEIEHFFDDAIKAAKRENEQDLLLFCHAIESYFNFPAADQNAITSRVPTIMYKDMESKLRKLNKIDLIDNAIKLIPEVRAKAGMPPLVPPMDQIIATQAIKCAVNMKLGRPMFDNPTVPYILLVKGEYGATPLPIKPDFRKLITGSEIEGKFDEASFPLRKLPPEKQPSKNPMIALRDQVLIELYPVLAQSIVETDIKENP